MITKLSATKLESFVICPYRYYLKYVRRSLKSAPATIHMVFGILIHKVLENFIEYVTKSTLPEDGNLLKFDLLNQLLRIFKQRIEEFKGRYPRALAQLNMNEDYIFENYIETFFQWFMSYQLYTKNLRAEVEFSIPLLEVARTLPQDQLHPLYTKYKHILLTGKKDLVIGSDIIVDFKTHYRPDKAALLLTSFQTILYTLIDDMDMTFLYLYVKKPLKETRLQLAKAARLQKFNDLIEAIDRLSSVTKYNKNPKGCGGCIFRKLCLGK